MGKPDRENFPWNLVISSCLLDSGSTSVRCLIFERDLVLAEGLGEWSVFPPGDWGVSVSMAISMGLHALPQQLVGVPTTLTRAPGLYNHTDPWSQEAPWHAVLRVSPSAPQRPRPLWRCLGGHSRGSKQEAECGRFKQSGVSCHACKQTGTFPSCLERAFWR